MSDRFPVEKSALLPSVPITVSTAAYLPALLEAAGGEVSSRLRYLHFLPRDGATAYLAVGSEASASSLLLPVGGYGCYCNRAAAGRISLFASPSCVVDVYQHG